MANGIRKTELGFNQWDLQDKPRMEDFNADNKLADELIGALRGEMGKKANLAGATFAGAVHADRVAVRNDTNPQVVLQDSKANILGSIIYATGTSSMRMRLHNNGEVRDIELSSTAAMPHLNGLLDLGSPRQKWKDAYFINAPAVGSDRNSKKDISPLVMSTVIKLLMSIPAVQYRLIDGDSGRLHFGFIAQDVEKALTTAELTTMEFAGFIKSAVVDGDGNATEQYLYALRLEEFIPILWAHQQDVERRLQAAGI